MMNKTINVGLDTGELTDLVKKLKQLSNDMKKLPSLLAEEVANDGLEELNRQYTMTNQENVDDIEILVEQNNNGYKIVGKGKDVIYAEFGTGEVGKENPHDRKNEFNLNDYNSGPFVSTHVNSKGRHYWFYKGYTEGIPAGKQFFNTSNYIRNKGVKKISERLVGDMLSKL